MTNAEIDEYMLGWVAESKSAPTKADKYSDNLDNLVRLAAIIKARTPGRWTRARDSANFVKAPTEDICACIVNVGDGYSRLAGDQQCKPNADFIAALGSCADEMLAVALATKKAEHLIYQHLGPFCPPIVDALAALDARLAAVLPGGEP